MDQHILWDGSFLGAFPRKCLNSYKIQVKDGFRLQIVRTEKFVVRCLLKALKDTSMPSILDEFKPYFGLKKLGTHRIKIGGRMYVMYKCELADLILSKYPKKNITKEMEEQMQKLIAFRYIFAVPSTQNSSFMVRKVGKEQKIYSWYEPQSLIDQNVVEPGEAFLNKWLNGKDLLKFSLDLLSQNNPRMNKAPIDKDEEWSVFLFRLRATLDEVIKRVDSTYLWMGTFIVERLVKLRQEIDE